MPEKKPSDRIRASGWRGMVTTGMRTQSEDTALGAECAQVSLLREATVARRMAIAVSLSQTIIGLARSAIRRCSPNLSERELILQFVDLHYGPELAERLRADLERRPK